MNAYAETSRTPVDTPPIFTIQSSFPPMPAPTARQLKEAAGLARRKGRAATGQFLVEGWRSVMSALDAGASIEHVFMSPGLVIPEGDESRLPADVVVLEVSEREMKKLSDVSTPPGILAVVGQPERRTLDPWPDRILLLDGVQDPGNVGTLIRTAAWLGIDAVAFGPGTADPYAPKVVRSTMGGLWDVAMSHVDDLPAWLDQAAAHKAGIWVTDMAGTSLEDWQPSSPSVVVIGSEAHGVSDAVRRAATGTITIRGAEGPKAVESLNAAVAGAIVMSHWAAPGSRSPV